MGRLSRQPRADVVAAKGRFAARRRAARWRSVRPMLVVATAATVAAAVGWVFLDSDFLVAREVTVQGTSRLAPEDVRVAAAVAPGTPLARLDLGAVERRVEALPAVAAADVRREWPHAVRIRVQERTPVAVVRSSGGLELVDGSGVPFGRVAKAPRGTVPLSVGGDVPGPGEESARAALSVYRSLPGPLRSSVTALDAPSPSSVAFTLRGGRTVVWGAPDHAGRKAAVLTALLKQPARHIDVSAPGVAVTR